MTTIEYFLAMMQFMMASQRFIIMSKTFFGGKCVQNNLGVGVRPSFRSMPKISLIFLSKSVPKQGMTLYLIKNHFSFAWYFAWRFLSICYNIAHPYMHKTGPELLFHLLHPSGKLIIFLSDAYVRTNLIISNFPFNIIHIHLSLKKFWLTPIML